MSLLPLISSKTLPFLAKLDHLVETGENFALEPLLTSLTFDIIGEYTHSSVQEILQERPERLAFGQKGLIAQEQR